MTCIRKDIETDRYRYDERMQQHMNTPEIPASIVIVQTPENMTKGTPTDVQHKCVKDMARTSFHMFVMCCCMF